MSQGRQTAKPFLKWAGGKGRLIPQLSEFYPKKFNNYYEPFFGGGAVFFSLDHTGKSHINDINVTLIDAYVHVHDDVVDIVQRLKQIEKNTINSQKPSEKTST